MNHHRIARIGLILLVALGLFAGLSLALAGGDHDDDHAEGGHTVTEEHHDADHGAEEDHAHGSTAGNLEQYVANVSYTLRTSIVDGGMAFIGVGGEIDGVQNPTLVVPHGAVVEIVLINGDGIEHDVTFPAFEAMAEHIATRGEQAAVAFVADQEGIFEYHCALPGHVQAGMKGTIMVQEVQAEAP